MDDMSEYKKLYAIESAEHLQTMNDALLSLEKDAHSSETINVMFRAAHTLKGMSATMGYTNIAELTHKMENLMDRVRKNEIKLDAEAIDVLFECLDTLEGMSENPENSSQCDISSLILRILSITNKEEPAQKIEKKPEETRKAQADNTPESSGTGCNVFDVTVTLDGGCRLKSSRAGIALRNLSELGRIIGTSPSEEDLDAEKFGGEFRITVSTNEDAAKIQEAVNKIYEVSKVEVRPSAGITAPPEEKTKTAPVSIDTAGCRNVFDVMVMLERGCRLKSARSAIVIRNLSELGRIIGTSPSEEDLDAEKFDREFRVTVSTNEDAAKIQDAVNIICDVSKVEVRPSAQIAPPAAQVTPPEQVIPSTAQITPPTEVKAQNATVDNKPEKSGIGCSIFTVKITLDNRCELKGARAAIALRNLSELGKIVETSPSEEDLEDEKFDQEFRITISTNEDAAAVEGAVTRIYDVLKVEVTSAKPAEEIKKLKEKKIEKEKSVSKSLQSVRVSIERLDSMMNLVGELVINKIRLVQLASDYDIKPLDEALAGLDRLTSELQDQVMASRMVPLEQIFNRFPRMIRDLAKIEGKDIRLVVTGSDIELDRTIIDEIGDPLVHLLRNCVDHGIESPEIRKHGGKYPEGTIKLTARRERNYVAIEVEDDGKGMDPLKFREIAVNKGIMKKEDADKLSDAEALNLSYLPGFTTAEKVTEISGRGVGMDVVKTRIEGMGGSVRLESTYGTGTKLILKLPLTVAIIHSQMVKVGTNIYAIPISNVVRDVAIKKDQIKTVQSEEVVMMMDEVLPLVRLDKLFGCTHNYPQEQIVVVVERMGSNIGLVVDELIGQQEVIIKNLDSRILRGIKGFAGATILGDGNVALILDVGTLI